MKILKSVALLSLFFSVIPNALVAEIDATCGGESTIIYSSKDTDLTICHAPYTKIEQAQLNQWQYCEDALIQISDKKQSKTTNYMDCELRSNIQFMLQGNVLKLRHHFTEYPGFEMKPFLIENYKIASNKKTYEFVEKLPACNEKEIDETVKKIDSTIAAPFDGKTYFKSIYSNLFKLRDCAISKPDFVLATLEDYQKNGVFDGEVAETLVSVIDEVKLISKATK